MVKQHFCKVKIGGSSPLPGSRSVLAVNLLIFMKRNCVSCGKILLKRHQIKFCSNSCQGKYRCKNSVERWKRGLAQGGVGISTRIISSYLRNYLFEKYDSRCSKCGWNERNEFSGRIPLEVDHIDGNSENNAEDNLRLLCPNCHSLTPYFKNLNKGNGRKWRLRILNERKK